MSFWRAGHVLTPWCFSWVEATHTRMLGEFPCKFGKIVPETACDVNDEGCIGAGISSRDKLLLNWVQGQVHPMHSTLTVAAHF
jgi:hypothetical protein